ncbi:MAG: nucleotidyl transferase AbiEii/AbiGii toxin family protein [Planctomycetes bacterium]|nr:nucleotidyl transferase AbiEii/AbiGii toxin family protein [Planctomycetota bacterium]
MAAPAQYKTPLAFKSALESRIRNAADGRIARFRQLLLFDRFLARIFAVFGERVVLKGGIVLELRLERARTTKDIDLRLTGSTDDLLEQFQEAGRLELGDWLQFEVTPDPRHPVMEGEGLVYQGQRFRVVGQLAGKQYSDHFGLDVGMADALTAEPEIVSGSNFLEFVELSPASFRIYPRVTHVAEKLHAYTLPRERENSRVKDLPDIALLAQTGTFVSAELREALEGTFAFRDSHPLPAAVPVPPEGWEGRYARIAQQDGLVWKTMEDVYRRFA